MYYIYIYVLYNIQYVYIAERIYTAVSIIIVFYRRLFRYIHLIIKLREAN